MHILAFSLFILTILIVHSSALQKVQSHGKYVSVPEDRNHLQKSNLSKEQLDVQHKIVVDKIKKLFTPTYSDTQLLSLMTQLYQDYEAYQHFQEHREYSEHQTKFRQFFKMTPQHCNELEELISLFAQYFSMKNTSENIRERQFGIYKQLKSYQERNCPQKTMLKPNNEGNAVLNH